MIRLQITYFLLFTIGLVLQGQNNQSFKELHHKHTTSNDSSVVIQLDNDGRIFIQKWSNNIYRFTYETEPSLSQPSDAVILTPSLSTPTNQEETWHWPGDDEVIITLTKSPFNIQLSGSTGSVTFSPIIDTNNAATSGLRIHLKEEEMITGGGARAIPMNRRGFSLRLNNEPHWGYSYGEENLNYSVPVFLSSEKYMVFFDAPQRAHADIGKSDNNNFDLYSELPQWSAFLILGDDYKELLVQYTKLTGTQPLPPQWVLGHMASRFGYRSQKETMYMAEAILANGYPLDAIIIDLYWFGKGMNDFRMGNLDWEPDFWPNPDEMIKYLNDLGVKTILISEPFIMEQSSNFTVTDSLGILGKDSIGNSYVIEDFWFGPAGLLDVFKEEGQDWFWQQYDRLKQQGIAGWWGDLGEPEKHPSGIHYQAGNSDEIHNTYGHYWSKILHDNYKEHYPNDRLFFLNRAGYAGSQRYSVFPWSGDVSRSWNGLKAQLPIMLGMSLNGIPYMHSDLGGFAAGTKDEELYLRWMQFGVFNPVFRPHGESIPSEPIFFSDTIQKILKEFVGLRYELMTYNYTLAWQQTNNGLPLARPLILDYPDEEKYFNHFDSYMWGDAFLVAPVIERGAQSIEVDFPEGDWYHYFSEKTFQGNQKTDVEVQLKTLPVFIKAGSIIPTVNRFKNMASYPTDSLFVNYYFDPELKSTTYTLYEDDGKNAKAIETGTFELTTLSVTPKPHKLTCHSESNNGKYVGQPTNRKMVWRFYHLPESIKTITINQSKIKMNTLRRHRKGYFEIIMN